MGSLAADFSGLKRSLFELVGQRATGTLFVATMDNHSAQLVLSRGQLLGIAHNGLHNKAALNRLSSMAQLRFSFTPELIYPLMETLLPEQAEQLLEGLGYHANVESDVGAVQLEPEEPELSEPANSKGTLRVYRGQVIQG